MGTRKRDGDRMRWSWSIERSNSSAATGPALIRAVANATSPSPRSLWAPLRRVWSRVKAACVVVKCPARAAASMSSGNAQVASHRLYQGRRKGLFARDVYAAASEIDRVEDDPVKGDKVILNAPEDMLLQEASDG
jgi:hypothetical protein